MPVSADVIWALPLCSLPILFVIWSVYFILDFRAQKSKDPSMKRLKMVKLSLKVIWMKLRWVILKWVIFWARLGLEYWVVFKLMFHYVVWSSGARNRASLQFALELHLMRMNLDGKAGAFVILLEVVYQSIKFIFF